MTNETTAPERIWFNGGLIESHMHTSRREFAGGVEYVRADALEAAQARIAELEGALRDVREEICTGPVNDVLWHNEIPSETTVDFICNTLNDDWDYDKWLETRAALEGKG